MAIFALGLIGVDYRFGGDTPQRGLDCSGLVRYVFSHTTGIELPRTAAAQGKLGARVSRLDLVPGDLVFFNTRHATDSHVGIYLGDNRFVHAPSKGSEVSIASLDDGYWKKRFTGARRLVGVLTAIEAREADALLGAALAARRPRSVPAARRPWPAVAARCGARRRDALRSGSRPARGGGSPAGRRRPPPSVAGALRRSFAIRYP